jgi:hypothetical protein
MRRKNYANVEWTVDDVIENCEQFGIQVTKDTAQKVLALAEHDIVDAMVTAGWQVIEEALLESQK